MEEYKRIFLKEDDVRIRPGESFSFDFPFDGEGGQRLFFTGENDFHYFLKTEMGANALYSRISDSLVPGRSAQYALRMRGSYHHTAAMKKILFPPVLYMYRLVDAGDEFDAGVTVEGKDIKINDGGYLRMYIEIWDSRPGVPASDTRSVPDRTVAFDCPEGTYGQVRIGGRIRLPSPGTACAVVYVEGENFTGEALFEDPGIVSSNGFNILAPFAPDMPVFAKHSNWAGVGLSRWEWPEAEIRVNGVTVFNGEFFERCHRYSEFEFPLPGGVLKKGNNTLSFRVKGDYRDAPAYRLHEVGLVSDGHSLIAAVPESAVAGKEFSLLLDPSRSQTLEVSGDVEVLSDTVIKVAGLCALRLVCRRPQRDLRITVNGETAVVSAVREREDDGVVTGTGDMIYIDQNDDSFRTFFKWYFSNGVGNLITVRPTYRWSGTKKSPPGFWKKTAKLMSDMGVKYSHMVDGREPPGITSQPSVEELEGRGFLGRQLHERDGAYNYWSPSLDPPEWMDLNGNHATSLKYDWFCRQAREDPAHCGMMYGTPNDLYPYRGKLYLFRDFSVPADMKAQAEATVAALSKIRYGCPRHTGPSVMFKYFHMAGYEMTGAETMDSPTEFLLAALRGVADAYGQKTFSVHHALQWSTTPHDDERRYRRYRLALYVSWAGGAHETNTEEGLWHLEEYYSHHHRFSPAALEHLKVQKGFYRYVTRHSRRGRLRARTAVIHGRYDGASCFGREALSVFGMPEDQASRTFDAEMSWHLPRRIFYPNTVNGFRSVAHGEASKRGPIGLVSGNPYGHFNIVPVEEDWPDYPFLAFFGYNCAESGDLDRVFGAIKKGAAVMMTLAHLSSTTSRSDVENYRLEYEGHPFLDAIGFDYSAKRIRGGGKVCEIPLGKGRAIIFNEALYPANPKIRDEYVRRFSEEVERINRGEYVFPIVGCDVSATVYDTGEGTGDAYFIAVDWWNDPDAERHAGLRIGKDTYDIPLRFGVMKKVTFCTRGAVECERESGEIISFDGNRALLEGDGTEEFTLLKDGKRIPFEVEFGDDVRKEIDLRGIR